MTPTNDLRGWESRANHTCGPEGYHYENCEGCMYEAEDEERLGRTDFGGTVTGDGSPSLPSNCASMHVREADLRRCIEGEKKRGYWRNATVDEAVDVALAARRSGPCACSCHED